MSFLDQIETDLDVFLNDFAVNAVFQHGTDTLKPVKVIFDSAYKRVDLQTGVESSGPSAIGKTSDFAGAIHGDKLTINSTLYYIIGVEPDGTGLTTFRLSEDM